jgi:hypothetical protein
MRRCRKSPHLLPPRIHIHLPLRDRRAPRLDRNRARPARSPWPLPNHHSDNTHLLQLQAPTLPHLALSGVEPFWQAVQPLTFHSLKQFALTYYIRLRQLPDWKAHYETLEMGARLDIGLSMEKQNPRFFVNEITRFTQGSWFSQLGPAPGLMVMMAFGRALNDYFP